MKHNNKHAAKVKTRGSLLNLTARRKKIRKILHFHALCVYCD